MIDDIISNKLFRPLNKLRDKYIYYVISAVLLGWIMIFGFLLFIVLITDEPLPDAFITFSFWVVGIGLSLIVILSFFVNIYFQSISYEITDDEIHVFVGIITKTRKIVPFRTITNMEIKEGPYDRALNLATIEIQTAGNSQTKMGPEEKLEGLPAQEVDKIQEVLVNRVRKMRGTAGVTHDLEDEDAILANILHEVRELRKHLSNR